MTEKQWLTHCLGDASWPATWHIHTLCCGLSETDSCLAVRSAGWRGKEMKQSCGGVKPNDAGGDGIPDDSNLRGGFHSYKEAW